MKFKEYLELNEMQIERKKAIRQIEHLRPEIIEHLIKAIKYYENRDTEKHINEMLGQWVNKINDMKIKNNIVLSKDNYISILSISFNDFTNNFLNKTFKSKYKDYVVARTDEETYLFLIHCLNELSEMFYKKNIQNFRQMIYKYTLKKD